MHISTSTSSAVRANLQIIPLPDTLERDHAVSTSSVDAAACLRLTEFELVRGSGGQMEAPHGSHAFKKSRGRKGGGNQQPTDGKVRGV